VRALKARAGDAGIVAVIKANAYGHGAVGVARRLVKDGVWGLAVTSVEEAEELRRAAIEAPILVLGHSEPVLAERLVAADLRPAITTIALGKALSEAARRAGKTVRVHLKVDTGMNRYGTTPEDAVVLANALRELPNIEVEALFSHFATADETDDAFLRQQYDAFAACAARLDWIGLCHVSNSAATLARPDLALNLVRVGFSMYGQYPSAALRSAADLTPVLTLKSRVARVHRVGVGETAGYGRAWRAERPSTLALVMAGYGDGVRRRLSNNADVLIHGKRAPYAGRVSMDMTIVDITDIPGVAVGDEVVLFGRQGDELITADELAERSGTIAYEILTGMAARVTRLYVEDGRIVARQDLAGFREASAP
jgi:alanine racemase